MPSRQGVHCPQDSWAKNRTIRSAARTTQVVSSMTTTAPDPSIEPALAVSSLVTGRSRWSAGHEPGSGGSARDPGLELAIVADASGDVVDHLPPGEAVGQFVIAGLAHVTRDREQECAGVGRVTESLEVVDPPARGCRAGSRGSRRC